MNDVAAVRQVSRRGISDEAADLIREAILSDRFQPGAALREVELAAMLGVSRGSVREGLAVLESEGLIHRVWHQGTKVIDVTRADVEEVYAVRAALDRLAAVTASTAGTATDFDALDGLVDAMDRAVGATASGPELVALDMAYHDRIYETAGNTRLTQAWRTVRSQIHLFQLRRVEQGSVDYRAHIVEEHREIVRLLRSGTPTEIARGAEQHVHSAMHSLLEN